LSGFGNFVVFCFAVVFRLAPGPRNPSILFQPYQCRVQRSLVEIEEAIGDLLQPGGDLVGVLRAHGGKRAQDDKIERALEQLNLIFIFAWHPSDLPPFRIAQAVLECQVEMIFLKFSALVGKRVSDGCGLALCGEGAERSLHPVAKIVQQ
jgi:hypothetical protein